jgi:hypothetical protein
LSAACFEIPHFATILKSALGVEVVIDFWCIQQFHSWKQCTICVLYNRG